MHLENFANEIAQRQDDDTSQYSFPGLKHYNALDGNYQCLRKTQ